MSPALALSPWQVWPVDLGAPIGSEQGGRRPVVVVGSEDHCRFPIEMALVIPLTTRYRGLPHHVAISSADSGLDQPSWARTDDIRAVSQQRFLRWEPLGRLSQLEREQVRDWMRRMLA